MLAAGSVAVVVWEFVVVIPLVMAVNEFSKTVLEVVGVTLATNVLFTLNITERVKSADDIVEDISLNVLLAVGTVDAVMFELTVRSKSVVSTGAVSVIGVTVVADNEGVDGKFVVNDDANVLSRAATVSFKVCNLIEVSIISSLEKVISVIDVGNVVEAVAVVT